MPTDIRVKPATIQRNKFDVAVELTKLYVDNYSLEANDIEAQFAKFYALAKTLETRDSFELRSLVPEEILSKLN